MKFPNDYNEFGLIRDYGDILEKHFAGEISERIPSYARIWAEYIGNDGSAHALPMEGAKETITESRQKYWQCIYTLFESLAFCWHIERELTATEKIEYPEHYIQYLNLWMSFYAHLGRIHDMVEDIACPELKRKDLLNPFEEYWKQRHIVLHGRKIPLKNVNGVAAVPDLGEGNRHWNDGMLWEQLGPADFKQIHERVTVILREIEPALDRFLAEIRKALPKFCDWRPVNWAAFLKARTGWEEGMIAGSAGWVHPSGVQTPPSGSR
jgi:hypothetical protein